MFRMLVNDYEEVMEQAYRARTRPLYFRNNRKDSSMVVSSRPITIQNLFKFVQSEFEHDYDAMQWAKKYYSQSKAGRITGDE